MEIMKFHLHPKFVLIAPFLQTMALKTIDDPIITYIMQPIFKIVRLGASFVYKWCNF